MLMMEAYNICGGDLVGKKFKFTRPSRWVGDLHGEMLITVVGEIAIMSSPSSRSILPMRHGIKVGLTSTTGRGTHISFFPDEDYEVEILGLTYDYIRHQVRSRLNKLNTLKG